MDHCGRHGGGVRPGPGAGLSHPAAHHGPCLGGPGGLRGGGAAVFRHVPVPLYRQHPAKAVRGAALPVRFRLSQFFRAPVSGGAALPGGRGPGGGAVHRGCAAVHPAAGPVPVPPPAPLQRPRCLRVFGGHVPAAVLCVPAVPGAVRFPLPGPGAGGAAAAGGPALRRHDLRLPLPVPGRALPGPHRRRGRPGAHPGHGVRGRGGYAGRPAGGALRPEERGVRPGHGDRDAGGRAGGPGAGVHRRGPGAAAAEPHPGPVPREPLPQRGDRHQGGLRRPEPNRFPVQRRHGQRPLKDGRAVRHRKRAAHPGLPGGRRLPGAPAPAVHLHPRGGHPALRGVLLRRSPPGEALLPAEGRPVLRPAGLAV